MSEKTCGTCQFRGTAIENDDSYRGDESDAPTGYFLCERIQFYRQEGLKESGFVYTHYPRGQGAVVHDGSGYYAALCVESDFGCNKWELRVADGNEIEP